VEIEMGNPCPFIFSKQPIGGRPLPVCEVVTLIDAYSYAEAITKYIIQELSH
jgi:hypothetical protein